MWEVTSPKSMCGSHDFTFNGSQNNKVCCECEIPDVNNYVSANM